jgi:hypothetical protein
MLVYAGEPVPIPGDGAAAAGDGVGLGPPGTNSLADARSLLLDAEGAGAVVGVLTAGAAAASPAGADGVEGGPAAATLCVEHAPSEISAVCVGAAAGCTGVAPPCALAGGAAGAAPPARPPSTIEYLSSSSISPSISS